MSTQKYLTQGWQMAGHAQARMFLELLPLTRVLQFATDALRSIETLREYAARCPATKKALDEACPYWETRETDPHLAVADLADLVHAKTQELTQAFEALSAELPRAARK